MASTHLGKKYVYLWDNFYLVYHQCLGIFSFIYPYDVLAVSPEISSHRQKHTHTYTHIKAEILKEKFEEDNRESVRSDNNIKS